MKTVLVSFASDSHKEHFKNLVNWAGPVFDELMLWDELELNKTWFYQHMIEKYGESFFKSRGFGYWSWKPALILAATEKYKNSFIIYCDANVVPRIKAKIQATDFINNSYFITRYEYFTNRQFTHRDCFVEMKCDDVQYWYAHQIWAAVLGFKTEDKSVVEFIKTWDFWCRNATCVADQYKSPKTYNKENFPDFQDHRHDQSILSILVQKHRIPTKQFEPFFNQTLWKNR